jgi:hypothetical protein
VIEGVKIQISTSELREHLLKRVVYHHEKRLFYEAQAQQLRDGGVGTSLASNDPTQSLQRSAQEHGNKEGLFKFMTDHLVLNETYQLSEQDLTRLEIIDRYL